MRVLILLLFLCSSCVSCEAQDTFHAMLTDRGKPHEPQLLLINQQIGVMIWGQSNASGSTGGVAPTTSPIDYQTAIRGAAMYINSTGNFNTLTYSVNSQGDLFNSDLSMGYALHDALGRPVFIGMQAETGAPLWNDPAHTNFSPDAVGAFALIDDLLAVNLALKTRCALYGKTPFIISIWIGNEADSQTDDHADSVRINYQAVKDYLLANGGQIDAEIVSILHPNYANSTAPRITRTRARMQEYCLDTPGAYDQDMDAFPLRSDSIHFTGPGQELIGISNANIILDQIFGLGIETYPGGYSTDAKNALKNFRDDISTGYKDAVADFVDGCVTDGNWDNIVVFQERGMETVGAGLTDWCGIKYAVNTVGGTHDPGSGVTYDGVDDYWDTGFQPDRDGGTQFTLNNAGVGWFVVDNLDAGTGYLGGAQGNGNGFINIAQVAATRLAYNVNSAAGGQYTGETAFADNSLYMARRTASTGAGCTGFIKNATVVDGDNITSTVLDNRKLWEGAKDEIGTPNNFHNIKVGFFVVFDPTSFDYTAWNTRVTTLIADLAAL